MSRIYHRVRIVAAFTYLSEYGQINFREWQQYVSDTKKKTLRNNSSYHSGGPLQRQEAVYSAGLFATDATAISNILPRCPANGGFMRVVCTRIAAAMAVCLYRQVILRHVLNAFASVLCVCVHNC